MTHPWKSVGETRTVWFYYNPDSRIIEYLTDMRGLINKAILNAHSISRANDNQLPSAITLRKSLKKYYDNNIDYATHHINPVCRSAIAILRSYKKNNDGKLRVIKAEKLAMRIDSELTKIENNRLRVTLKPHEYEYIDIIDKNDKYTDYSRYPISEVLLTDTKACITFRVSTDDKPVIDNDIIGFDLNFKSVDYTVIENNEIVETGSIDTSDIAQAQRDYARKRTKMQKHIRNPAKRDRKLKEAKHRQRNITNDKIHKITTEIVRNNSDKTFVLEDLTNVKKEGMKKKKSKRNRNKENNRKEAKNSTKSKRFRTDINRWPYRLFQQYVDYKSCNETLYVDPAGTSSECPVCGGELKHPSWKESKCINCGVTYDRDKLASLSISVRGLYLCGTPFIVSGSSSWHSMKNSYLYHPDQVSIENASECKKEMYSNA
ncbi:MAG: zinc ribbon domain-containing protein [Thermoplasmata archaeon]